MHGGWCSFAVLLFLLENSFARKVVNIGGIFDHQHILQRYSFVYAVGKLNQQVADVEFRDQTKVVNAKDAVEVINAGCDIIDQNGVLVFGPNSVNGCLQAHSICQARHIPHVSTLVRSSEHYSSSNLRFNLFPRYRSIGRAILDLIREYNWTSFILLHDGQGFDELRDLLETNSATIRVYTIPNSRKDYKYMLKNIKLELKDHKIVVHADLSTSRAILEKAALYAMVNEHYQYIFTHLDIYSLDLAVYSDQGCKITALRIVEPASPDTTELKTNLRVIASQLRNSFIIPSIGIQTEAAVIFDAVNVLGGLLKSLNARYLSTDVKCAVENTTWIGGLAFMKLAANMPLYHGITGPMTFDASGQRNRVDLQILELAEDGFKMHGMWNEQTKLNYTSPERPQKQSLAYKTIRVTVRPEAPFVMRKQTVETMHGNEMWEGYCIDVLNDVANMLKFNYSIHVVRDGGYGSDYTHPNGSVGWNGVVGEVMRGEADLGVASLTITYARAQVIDFTVPYMALGISILYKKPDKQDPNLFSFLSPFSLEVWLYMLAAYLGVTMVMWVLARLSPYEWYNSHPCNPDEDTVENQFNLQNSMWFAVGSLMQQGSELAPVAPSTRLVAATWWFFTLIMIASYTANLAAFLTVTRVVIPIDSAEDLAQQTEIKYGCQGGGSTEAFFRDSKILTYENMWAFMSSYPRDQIFVKSTKDGIKRIRENNYAYLMESSMLEYHVEKNCDLIQIGGLLDSKGYGFALSKNSPYREEVSTAILQLQENTKLTLYKNKWWKQKQEGKECEEEQKSGHNSLGLQNTGGAFLFLCVGLLFGMIISLLEFLWNAVRNAEIDRKSIMSELFQDLKFALRFHPSKKSVVNKKQKREKQEQNVGILNHADGYFLSPKSNGFTK